MSNIPKSQKAVIFYEHNGPLEYKDVATPTPKPNELLINVKYSGVCHSDLHAWKGDWPYPTILPLIGGHEGIGEVVSFGSEVTGWSIGDLAGMKWLNYACMECEYCLADKEQACDSFEFTGYTTNGTFQQYATVDYRQAARIPNSASSNIAELSPILCGGLTSYSGIKSMGLKPGQWITIVGAAGGLGNLGIQFSKAMNLKVIALDSGFEKGQFVKELGADEYVDISNTENVAEKIIEITNGGSHGVLNVSSSNQALNSSFEYARKLGKVVIIGIPLNGEFKYGVSAAISKCLNIYASSVGNKKETEEAIQFALDGKVKCPIKVVGLSELPDVYKLMSENKVKGRYVVDTSR
ncbi:unnamed protein product [Candida verbasci]|uniref:alcohol dehydrogenase n=1 Tax=Candida verbasci TaxID=1227364 RepID=A0A9W4U007_9ASCO|nr:unnamed protein product [Candida verbasci]